MYDLRYDGVVLVIADDEDYLIDVQLELMMFDWDYFRFKIVRRMIYG